MPISETGNNISRQRGMTLVELLIVLIVMGLVTAVVVVTAPPRTPSLEKAVMGAVRDLQALSDTAIVRAQPLGLGVAEDIRVVAYRFAEGDWRAVPLASLNELQKRASVEILTSDDFGLPREAEDGSTLIIRGQRIDATSPISPDIVFGTTGEATPATLTIRNTDDAWVIDVTSSGRVEARHASP